MRSGSNDRRDSVEYAVFHRVDERLQDSEESFSFELRDEKVLDSVNYVDWFVNNKSVLEGTIVLLPAFYVIENYDKLNAKQRQLMLVMEKWEQKRNIQLLARLDVKANAIYVPVVDPDGYPMKFSLSLDNPFEFPPLEFSSWEDYESFLN